MAQNGTYYNYADYVGLAGTPGQYSFNPLNELDQWGVANTLSATLPGNLSLSWIGSVMHLWQSTTVDAVPSPLSLAINHWVVDYTQYTQELRLSGSVDRFNWTVGGYYFDYNATQGGRIALDGAVASPVGVPFFVPLDFLFNDPVHSNSKAGFAHLEFRATNDLTFTGGLRYTTDYKRYTYVRSAPPGFSNAESPAAASTGIETSITSLNLSAPPYTNNRFDYSATAGYQLTNDVHAYVEVATGFKGGGINPRPYYPEQVQPFAPETVDSYEFGVKSEFLDHRVRVNGDVFYEHYKNMQLTLFACPQFVPPGAPPNCYLPANVGTSVIKGAELETEVHSGANFMLNASATYINFSYSSVDPAALIPLSDTAPFTPKIKLDAGVQYMVHLGSAGSLTPRFDYLYVGEQYAAAQNGPLNRIPAYGLANARLTYRDASNKWELALQGTNIFDKYYFVNLNGNVPASNPSNTQTGYPGTPREFSISLKRHF